MEEEISGNREPRPDHHFEGPEQEPLQRYDLPTDMLPKHRRKMLLRLDDSEREAKGWSLRLVREVTAFEIDDLLANPL